MFLGEELFLPGDLAQGDLMNMAQGPGEMDMDMDMDTVHDLGTAEGKWHFRSSQNGMRAHSQ